MTFIVTMFYFKDERITLWSFQSADVGSAGGETSFAINDDE